jgi:hypothetical protein
MVMMAGLLRSLSAILLVTLTVVCVLVRVMRRNVMIIVARDRREAERQMVVHCDHRSAVLDPVDRARRARTGEHQRQPDAQLQAKPLER